tara:strand:- start:3210 stop:3350 length:141 start_codon:yes stop_codon:yes gene_type:complete
MITKIGRMGPHPYIAEIGLRYKAKYTNPLAIMRGLIKTASLLIVQG